MTLHDLNYVPTTKINGQLLKWETFSSYGCPNWRNRVACINSAFYSRRPAFRPVFASV